MVELAEGVLEITDLRNWTMVVENVVNQADRQRRAQENNTYLPFYREGIIQIIYFGVIRKSGSK